MGQKGIFTVTYIHIPTKSAFFSWIGKIFFAFVSWIRHGGIPVSNRNRVEVKMFEFKNRIRIKGLSRGNIRSTSHWFHVQIPCEHQ